MNDYFGLEIPFVGHCHIEGVSRDAGRVVSRVTLTPELLNSAGNGHGGLVMTLLDVTLATAARHARPGVSGVATVDMSVSFVEPANGTVTCEARVLRAGSSLVFCEGEVRGEDGGLVAKAMGTFKLRLAPAASGGDGE